LLTCKKWQEASRTIFAKLKKHNNMKFNKLHLLAISALVLYSCGSKQEETVTEAETVKVITVKAEERSYTPTMVFTGTVFANREANLGAALPGKVERIFFEEGQTVKKGDLIVELSDEMLTQAEIEYQALKKDYERVSRLREKGSISEMEYDHVKAKFEASEAKTQMVRKNTQVYAPFSGTIVERMMEEGEVYFINPGLDPGYSMRSGIVRLMQLDLVTIKFDLNEKDLAIVKAGYNADIEIDAYPKKTFSGEISSIKPMLTTLTRTSPAEVKISNPNGDLKPGMFARVTINLPEQKAVFIPFKTIFRLPGTAEDFVWVVKENAVYKTVVKRIYSDGDLVAVSGLENNAELIADGKFRVSEGQEVEVVRK